MTNEMNYFDSLMRNNENNGAIEYIDVKKVYDNPLNEGREIALIDELVDNLLQNGLQQPIIVKKEADQGNLWKHTMCHNENRRSVR